MARSFLAVDVLLSLYITPLTNGGETFVSRTIDVTRGEKVFKDYSVTVTDEALKKTPSWRSSADYPPVAARTAMKLAVKMKESLVKDSKDFKWELESVALRQCLLPGGLEKWYWIVHFEQHFQGLGSSGVPPDLNLVVLMDGTLIKPVVLKKAPDGR